MGSNNDGDLYNQMYYHGLLPREDIKSFLHNPGDLLVRMTEPSKPGQREYVISVLILKRQVWSESPNERLGMVEIAKKLESIFGIPRPVFESTISCGRSTTQRTSKNSRTL